MNKSFYERILDLRNRISLDGDDTIYEEDHLLLDEVLDLIENIGSEDADIEAQIYNYNNTVDIYNELETGIRLKKQEKLLELYEKLAVYRLVVIGMLLDEITDLTHFDFIKEFIESYGDEDTKITEEIAKIKELENE